MKGSLTNVAWNSWCVIRWVLFFGFTCGSTSVVFCYIVVIIFNILYITCFCNRTLFKLEPLKLHRVGTKSLWNRMKISSLTLHMYTRRVRHLCACSTRDSGYVDQNIEIETVHFVCEKFILHPEFLFLHT